MAQTVIGIFDSSAEAQQAVRELKDLGISEGNIDVSSSSPSGSTAGASYGSATGSTTTDHDASDSVGGFFRSLFSDDDERASTYSHVARHSDCIVTVHARSDEEARRAAAILDQYGSVDVDQRATEYGYRGNSQTAGAGTHTGNTTIPIIEENLQVGKREVETGGARLRSRIVERPVEEHLRLRSEHVRVERHAVNRPATEADFAGFREGEIEMAERAEVPVVNKEARVVEEVSLGKEVEERDEVVRETLRSTEVDVENLTTRTGTTNTTGTNYGTGSTGTGLGTDLDNDRSTAL
ncbi:YsnF/AvaK domain-containing protein [Rufibacter sediminis]|uniref:YsnF/AvaK domain-containing protein n=1 Tax=Rufibacter sediminis TaxID=2762756 RepID=A0ABR6VPB0_9BACT|nr:YsnF/AvaK domain-containing protein [Rufibacter sediminis]MBC3539008.1 YsnF/AvaK domain-containing protein [Rufibacter sediminis]